MASLDLGVLKISIGVNNQEANKQLGETGKELKNTGVAADEAGGRFGKLDNILKTAGKTMAVVAVAAAAAAIKLGKEVIKQFGELEQNLGGSEAVFGKYAASLQKTGEEAYRNLGVSQSQYLATANKMGALFQGSGIEQRKSLELTEMAMQRAADMASVMGIDMKTALDSVAGAAKGNFTMMDNLGVAMNATTIEAFALAKGLDFTWQTATQAEKAEVAMQMFFENTQQYAGNFARESTETITGSLGMLEASTSSFIAGLGNADADMTKLTNNMIESFKAVVKNIVPIIENIITALPKVIEAVIPAIGSLLPTLISTATSLFTQVLSTIFQLLPQLIPVVVDAVMTITKALIDNLPLLISAGILLITTLIEGIGEALPELIPITIDAIITIVDELINNLPLIIKAAIQIILALVEGLIKSLPKIVEAIPKIISSIIDTLIAAIPMIIDCGVKLITSLVENLPLIIITIVAAIPKIITSIVSKLDTLIPLIIQAGIDLFVALIENLPIVEIVKAIPQIISALINGFGEMHGKMSEIGLNLIKGIWNGINDAAAWLWNKVSGFCNNLLNNIKNFFGIKSPSTETAWFGEMLVDGLAEGIDDNADAAAKAMKNMGKAVEDAFNPSITAPELDTSAYSLSNGSITQKVKATLELKGGTAASGGVVQNNYFTSREMTSYEQLQQIKRLNKGLLGVNA